jgi:hypothetical protein
MLNQKIPGYIHQPGSFFLPQLGEARAESQMINLLRTARATAPARQVTPSLHRMLLTGDMMVEGLTINLGAMRVSLR